MQTHIQIQPKSSGCLSLVFMSNQFFFCFSFFLRNLGYCIRMLKHSTDNSDLCPGRCTKSCLPLTCDWLSNQWWARIRAVTSQSFNRKHTSRWLVDSQSCDWTHTSCQLPIWLATYTRLDWYDSAHGCRLAAHWMDAEWTTTCNWLVVWLFGNLWGRQLVLRCWSPRWLLIGCCVSMAGALAPYIKKAEVAFPTGGPVSAHSRL